MVNKLDALPLFPGVVYRGNDLSEMPAELVRKIFSVGGVYCDEAFTSASNSRSVAWHFAQFEVPNQACIMIIQSKRGRQIKDYVAREYKWEEEVLHEPRTSF
mmetsp:Transcript_16995/g.32261  ORF Transcript_16995/g.32261 Transcript_16995/m.32261 type:complete len:102 (-) Transcript_16995:26-331(-)